MTERCTTREEREARAEIVELDRRVEEMHGPFKPYTPSEKRGYIYFVQGEDGGPIKIGWAVDPMRRLQSIQTNSPVPLRNVALIKGTTRTRERKIHEQFAECRIRGEWFEPTFELIAFICGLRLCSMTPPIAAA